MRGQVPADGAQAAAGAGQGARLDGILRQFQPDVVLFHPPRRAQQAHPAGDEDRFGVAAAEGLEFPQPAGEHRRDAVQRKLGVDAEQVFGLTAGQVFAGVGAEAAFQLRQFVGGQGETHREGVAAEAREQLRAAFDGVEQLKAVNGAAGTVGDFAFEAFLDADDDRRLGGAFDHARGQNADDAAVPAFAVDHQQMVGVQLRIGRQTGFDGDERSGFRVSALAVEPFQLGGQFGGTGRVAGGEQLDHLAGHVHAPRGIDARSQPEGHVECGDGFGSWVQGGGGKQSAQAGPASGAPAPPAPASSQWPLHREIFPGKNRTAGWG